MKNKGLVITMIILLTIIVAILIVILCLGISGKISFMGFIRAKSKDIVYDEKYETEKIEKISIKSSAGDIKFEESDDKKIRVVVYGEKENKIDVEQTGNTLKVESIQKSHIFGFNIRLNDIVIYLPKEYEKEIEIDSDLGDIEIVSLENASIKIEQNCGDINLGKIKNAEIENDLGTTEIEEVLNSLNIKSNCGDIKIKKLTLQENSKIENDLGDVKIGETNDIFIDAHCDLGDEKIKNNSRQSEVTLKIDVDCGDIKVEN
jgi:DUF4097 and DUF4098 domain-containing protein YvlB